jgi:hypothetical protein
MPPPDMKIPDIHQTFYKSKLEFDFELHVTDGSNQVKA